MLEGIRVLLVEDIADHRRLYASALSERGATVVATGSVREALVLFERMAPHVIVSEISIVDGGGDALVRAIRARGSGVPALALTASTREREHARAVAAGFDEHCTKLADLDEFVAVVARLAGRGDDRLLRRQA
jgi:CheY-like chemotaxis protein